MENTPLKKVSKVLQIIECLLGNIFPKIHKVSKVSEKDLTSTKKNKIASRILKLDLYQR